MDETLRIPVTADQKRRITEAAKSNPSGLAAWARDVLLRAADELAAPTAKAKRKEVPRE